LFSGSPVRLALSLCHQPKMATTSGLLSINNSTHIINRLVDGFTVNSYSISPNYQFIAVSLGKQTHTHAEIEKLQIFYINPAGNSEFICVSNSLTHYARTDINSFMWSNTGKWFILAITRSYYSTYLKYNTEIWKHAIQIERIFNVNNSHICEIIQESKSYLTDDNHSWIASVNILPAILDYRNRVMIDDKLLFFISTDTTYKIYYSAGREYTQLCASNNVLDTEIVVGMIISSFYITHNSSEVITDDDGIEYISNMYSPIFMSSTSNVFVYTTYINVYAYKIDTINIPKLRIPPVDDNIIPMHIQEYPEDPSIIIIGHIQRNFAYTSKSYLIINLVANTYERKELPANLECITIYPAFNMAGPNTICMLEGPENNCVSYNLFTGEQHILQHIDTVSGFVSWDTTYYKTGIDFGKTGHREIYKDVLDPDNWFRCPLGSISNITKASPDNSTVIIRHSDKTGLSIQYTAKYCAEYNHGILASTLADELPAELITNIAQYSIC
jgi:hypothetical protein